MMIVRFGLVAAVAVAGWAIRSHLRTPVRRYSGLESVSRLYDTWTNDRVLERHWGEHLHAGWYGVPPVKKDFLAAKIDYIDDALNMGFADSSFDVVWAIESEMYMPDTQRFIQEMARVLKPGGRLVIAAWNLRDTRDNPLSRNEEEHLRLLVDQWAHTKFISIRDYEEILEASGLRDITVADWAIPTQPSWRQAVWEGFRTPLWLLDNTPEQFWCLARDAYTILRYHDAFKNGLCQYGMIRARKPG